MNNQSNYQKWMGTTTTTDVEKMYKSFAVGCIIVEINVCMYVFVYFFIYFSVWHTHWNDISNKEELMNDVRNSVSSRMNLMVENTHKKTNAKDN